MSRMNALYCYRFRIDRRGLALLARRHHHPVRSEDIGYQVHALLAACFNDWVPSPFALDPEGRSRGRMASVLAYGGTPWEEMKEHARATADSQVLNAFSWDQCAAKPMPEHWSEGARYRYAVRVCPVRRQKHADGRSRELDAFLASPGADPADPRPVMLRRQAVYEAWLREQVEGKGGNCSAEPDWRGGARIETCCLDTFRLIRLMWHDRARKLVPVPDPRQATRRGASGRPEAILSGTLTVTCGERFTRLLARGVGRHRAFGFGMLLLKRP